MCIMFRDFGTHTITINLWWYELIKLINKRKFLTPEIYSYFEYFEAARNITSKLISTSSSVVAQEHTLIRMAVCPCHLVPPIQQVPSF